MKTGRFPSNDDPVEHDEGAVLALHFEGDVIASPALAARETAQRIARTHEVDAAFDDLDYGRWRGQTVREIGEHERDAVAAWLTDPHARPHGGESIAMMSARIVQALERYAANDDGEPRIVVTHAIVVKAAMAHALGKPLASVLSMDLAPLSSIRIRRDDRRAWIVDPLNFVRE